jgi:hypothetical protein
MVKVINVVKRTNKNGDQFNALLLESGLELVKSQKTGRWYATSKRATITSTFDDASAQSLIGAQIPGSVQKVECEPYSYTIKETGETITLSHRWEFFKDGEYAENKVVVPEKVAMPL